MYILGSDLFLFVCHVSYILHLLHAPQILYWIVFTIPWFYRLMYQVPESVVLSSHSFFYGSCLLGSYVFFFCSHYALRSLFPCLQVDQLLGPYLLCVTRFPVSLVPAPIVLCCCMSTFCPFSVFWFLPS